jgi:hypothetical protein
VQAALAVHIAVVAHDALQRAVTVDDCLVHIAIVIIVPIVIAICTDYPLIMQSAKVENIKMRYRL